MLQISNLSIEFESDSTSILAVDDVNLKMEKGTAIGLVGESGSGKSVTALAIMQLLPPQANIVSGEIKFNEIDLLTLQKGAIQKLRGNNISMIFQEPMTALNPVMKCGKQVAESIILHQKISKKDAKNKLLNYLKKSTFHDLSIFIKAIHINCQADKSSGL